MWMVQQAKSAGAGSSINDQKIRTEGWDVVSSPIIHDKSDNKKLSQNYTNLNDREVTYADGKILLQQAAKFTGLNSSDTKSFISYLKTFCDPGVRGEFAAFPEVGNVNMAHYSNWLKQNYGIDVHFNNSGRTACSKL